jgi:hypothetical protein
MAWLKAGALLPGQTLLELIRQNRQERTRPQEAGCSVSSTPPADKTVPR